MNKMLGKIYCRLGRHDDVSISFKDGQPWKVYCRRCERLTWDRVAWDSWERQEDDKIKAEMREALGKGGTLVVVRGNAPEEKREMSKEKLVEEIGRAISGHCQEPPYGELGGDDMQLAREIITRIGKAYADGELKLSRTVGCYDDVHTPITFGQWAEDMFGDGARRFIAFRKEEEK